jgi:hypothetical protein
MVEWYSPGVLCAGFVSNLHSLQPTFEHLTDGGTCCQRGVEVT